MLDELQHLALVVQAQDFVDLPRDPSSVRSMAQDEALVLLVERQRRGYMAVQVGEVGLSVCLVRRY